MSKRTESIMKNMGNFNEHEIIQKIESLKNSLGIPLFASIYKKSVKLCIDIRLDYGSTGKKRARVVSSRISPEWSTRWFYMWGYDNEIEEPSDFKCMMQYTRFRDMGEINVTEVVRVLGERKKEFGRCLPVTPNILVEEKLSLLTDCESEEPRIEIICVRRVAPDEGAEVAYRWGCKDAEAMK